MYNISEIRMNRYSISFRIETVMERAMKDGLWSVMGCSLVLQRWSEGLMVEEVDLSEVYFWV